MGWKGATIGGYVGSILGGPFGAVFGAYFGHNVEKRLGGRTAGRQQRTSGFRNGAQPQDPISAAYATIGASPSDGTDTLKRKYRELAKRYHPDAMRARGATEDEIERASLRMGRINEAWAEIRSYRSI